MPADAPSPDLPQVAALENDDSMLTRRFGKEITNYYAGSLINRYSFLRADAPFLRRAAASPSSRYLALNNLNALVPDKTELAYLTFDNVKSLIGDEPYRLSEEESIKQYDSTKDAPLVVFLGMLEGGGETSTSLESGNHGEIKGQPYFAIDVTPRGSYAEKAKSFIKEQEAKGLSFDTDPRALALNASAAALYAQSRSILDWNIRNPFCAGCGKPNLTTHAGYKRVCPPTDRAGTSGDEPAQARPECPTRHGISNVCFPRTDPTMIAAVVSADGQRVLLGRQSRWPPHWFSTLAGFLEPGESIEEAVRREVWEEAGVRVGRVVVHSTQPWPYPSSLMIGAIAQALPDTGSEEVNLNDKELEAARWFSLEEARKALQDGAGGLGSAPPPGYIDGDLRLPPGQAIAHQLIKVVVDGYLSVGPKI